ncbi:MAG: DUF4388 domain-containing protein [candidate division Zixibacteria bacterium]|nr:DUF4388 domain-containing protein [candidate division Zixibacteria bacterium]
MDLSGSIEKFDLHQIFHLLSVGKKSGTLGVQRGDEITMVYFQQGEVIYAHSSTRPIGLGEILVQHKKITQEQLQEILNLQKELGNKKRIGELLVLESLITRSDLENFVKKQVEEIIYRLLSWESGHFKFFEDRFPTQEEITINISTENLILESVRRQKKMEKLKRRLPPLDAVLALAPSEDNRLKDLSLKADEWNILTLVDGRRNIEEVISLSGLEKEGALSKIAGLFLSGLVQKVDNPKVEADSGALEDLVKQFSKLLEEYSKNEGI